MSASGTFHRRRSLWRHVLELAVGVAVVSLGLRAWLVQGLIVPLTVSGGSMAETLHGSHLEMICPECQWRYAFGQEGLPAGRRTVCPNCGHREAVVDQAEWRQGDRLVVDRSVFQHRLPRRWEVIVFRCPDKATDLCIKRVVGLPGESVRIRHGDVYIDGQIARKGLADVRATAQLVHDASFVPRHDSHAAPTWSADRTPSGWQRQGAGFAYHPRLSANEDSIDWLAYRHRDGQPVRDDCGYNQGESRLLTEVSDLRLTCRVVARGPGLLAFRAADLNDRWEVVLHLASGRIELRRGERLLAEARGDLGGLERGAELELSLFDRQVLLALDGRLLLEHPFEPSDRPADPSLRPLAVGAAGLNVEVSDLKVWRDIHYTHPGLLHWRWGLSEPLQLKGGEIFVLGDNSPISHDSRTMAGAAVPVKLLIGKPLGVR